MVYVRAAAHGCLEGRFQAMVTAPICKESMYRRGFTFPGHTEYLAHVTRSARPIMAFSAPGLRVSLATVHVPLRQVFEILTPELILETLRISAQDLQRFFGISRPRIALCGLNPHAGESGHLGDEEQRFLEPALREARAEGIQVEGPLPADTVFGQAIRGRFDLVVALYHDQGLIPVKLLCFGESVNLTFGLPIIRTSVDHGVAYDIAGKGLADAASLNAAIRLALEIIQQQRLKAA
jgi:4-hydroxythreonine-4-phosphate dehydrogenase